jgi:peptidoglycan/xylan/chitin deacetylase (PgdA/CDA1 family)
MAPQAWQPGSGEDGIPPILSYHSVSPYRHDPYQITVSPARFEQQIRSLRRSGLTGVSMRELLEVRGRGDGRRLVGLTFDDGYADFAEYVLPVLAHYGFSATVFVVADLLGRHNVWDPAGPRKELLTADQVRQVADAGMEIGSHGLRHVLLPDVADADLVTEIATSRHILQQVSGQQVAGFCYPGGAVERHIIEGVEHAGYDYACAVGRSALTGRHALPRSCIGDTDSPFWIRAKLVRHWLTWSYRGPGAERLSHAAAAVTLHRRLTPAAKSGAPAHGAQPERDVPRWPRDEPQPGPVGTTP